MPTTASGAIANQVSNYVASVAYAYVSTGQGLITATAKGDAAITGSTVTLTGDYNSTTGQVIWTCGGSILTKYMPSSCR